LAEFTFLADYIAMHVYSKANASVPHQAECIEDIFVFNCDITALLISLR
jgi:hypothetical protein